MLTKTKILSSAALGLTLACLAPAAGRASEVAVPAAGCTETAFTAGTDATATTARVGGGFAAVAGASASLICPVPTDELDSGGGGDDDDDNGGRVTFRISFLDGDGNAADGATVSARLFRTTLALPVGDAAPVVVDTAVCPATTTPLRGGATPGPTQAGFSCPRLAENGFYHLKVNLTSSADFSAAFAGAVADD